MSRTLKTDPWLLQKARAHGVRVPKYDSTGRRDWQMAEVLELPWTYYELLMISVGKKEYRKTKERQFRAAVRDGIAHERYDTLPTKPGSYEWDIW